MLLALGFVAAAWGQAPILPPGDGEPILRLEAAGPTSYVTALAFSPNGQTLYAAGWDKVIHVWSLDPKTNRFEYAPAAAFRLPVGPGLQGAINAMALSSDGRWLAVGGTGTIRDTAGFRQHGLMAATRGTMTATMRQDEGLIYVFHTATRQVRLLRRQLGPTWGLAFAPVRPGEPPLLVSSAREWDEEDQKYVGSLRLWNIAAGTHVSGYFALPGDLRVRPSLAAWHTGAAPHDVRVAAVWGDSQLLLWDVRNEKFDRIATEQPQLHLAALPAQSGFVTGGAGQVIIWQFENGGPVIRRRVALPQAQLSAAGSVLRRPGAAEQTVIVTVDQRDAAAPELAVVDLQSGEVTRSPAPIWTSGGPQPVLAASANGVHLAVAGNREHEVLVYRAAELRANGAPQRLRGVGKTIGHAAFVKRGPAVGIALSEAPIAEGALPAGSLVFDVAARTITALRDDWRIDRAETAGWRVEAGAAAADRRVPVRVEGPDGLATVVRLDPGQQVSALALSPAVMASKTPILAVASHDLGQPSLTLFDAATGMPVRQLTGHTERIGALAFSADGRLLVSTSADRTVAVWSLVDLVRQHLGRRGRIAGLSLAERDGKLIAQLDATADFGPALQTGDVLLGIVDANALEPFKTATEFVNTLARMSPGQKVVLRRARNGAHADVAVPVVQAIDERKPLFSLFIAETPFEAEQNVRPALDWIGFTPIGPYESSHRRIERFLGWHFNTGKPEAPTAFALAEVYRRTYFRAGLLNDLLREGEYRPTAARPPMARPRMALTLTDGSGTPLDAAAGLPRIERLPVRLHLSLYGIEADQVASVRWRQAGGEWQPMEMTDELHWSADATATVKARGRHDWEVALRTAEDRPQEFTARISAQRQLPPPAVVVEAPADRRTLRQAEIEFAAQVTKLADGNEPALVRLTHHHHGQKVKSQQFALAAPGAVRAQFTLLEGSNTFELEASNQSAPAGQAAAETIRYTRVVVYSPVPAQPPTVAVKLLDQTDPPQPVPFDKTQGAYVASTPQLRLAGQIDSTEPLSRAELATGKAASRTLAGFTPGTVKKISFDELLPLEPGANSVRLSAKSASSIGVEERLNVVYRPPVPDAHITAPADGAVLIEGRDAQKVEVEARWTALEPKTKFELALLVNGQAAPGVFKVDEKPGTAVAEVSLAPGENHLSIRAYNEWGSVRASEMVTVCYRRPPRIVRLEHLAPGSRPFVNVTAEIESPADRRLLEVRLQDRALPQEALVQTTQREGRTVWRVSAHDVPLEKGTNRLVLVAANADGTSLEPASLEVSYEPTPPAKARIDIIEPAASLALDRPELAVEFRVRSATPLQSYGLYDGDQPLFVPEKPAAALQSDGTYLVKARPSIRLKRGTNYLTIRALNEGGEATASLVVSYVYTPVRFQIHQVAADDSTDAQKPRLIEGNRIAFAEPVPEGIATVGGELIWNDPADKRLSEAQFLRVFVNGFQQSPVRLQPAVEGRRKFQARIVCNQEKANRVAFVLPGLEYDVASRTEFTLDTTRPVRDQQLHLLVVGPGERRRGRLAERALEALHVKPGAGGSAGPFSVVHVYGPLVDYVSPQKVMTQFERIRAAVALRGQAGARNDVVMVFYQGEESLGKAGQFYLLTSDSQYDPRLERSGLGSEDLGRFFARTPGAHVLLLDVARSDAQPRRRLAFGRDYDNWPEESHVGVLRYAWRQQSGIPDDGRLVLALEQAPPTASRLKEVESEVARRSGELASATPGLLVYERYLPADLENLLLRGP